MGQQSFGDRSHLSEPIEEAELRFLLERLERVSAAPELDPPDHHATVAAVCEATGESAERVWEVLEEIRRGDLEARVAERLREAEEPLYRVERPGHSRDPLSSETWVGRRRAYSSILDTLPRADRPRVAKRLPQQSPAERTTAYVATAVAFLVLALFLVASILALRLATQGLPR